MIYVSLKIHVTNCWVHVQKYSRVRANSMPSITQLNFGQKRNLTNRPTDGHTLLYRYENASKNRQRKRVLEEGIHESLMFRSSLDQKQFGARVALVQQLLDLIVQHFLHRFTEEFSLRHKQVPQVRQNIKRPSSSMLILSCALFPAEKTAKLAGNVVIKRQTPC